MSASESARKKTEPLAAKTRGEKKKKKVCSILRKGGSKHRESIHRAWRLKDAPSGGKSVLLYEGGKTWLSREQGESMEGGKAPFRSKERSVRSVLVGKGGAVYHRGTKKGKKQSQRLAQPLEEVRRVSS